ncbi:MAG: GNAT family N-acetyltransferase [Saprospiraceae bacterium]|nr:GNAT family N-acetyltransferase [Saprospiraceae bacterium]
MIAFTTARLDVKEMCADDLDFFIELLSAPEIIEPIPQTSLPKESIIKQFDNFSNYSSDPKNKEKVVWGVYEKNTTELIGLCALLTNDENQREIGYRFRQKYWGLGYGTELTRNMIEYCFSELGLEVLTADVSVKNRASVKILEKFFEPIREFYNEQDQCIDRRYVLHKKNYLLNQTILKKK